MVVGDREAAERVGDHVAVALERRIVFDQRRQTVHRAADALRLRREEDRSDVEVARGDGRPVEGRRRLRARRGIAGAEPGEDEKRNQ